jgi:hypothetical protein
VLGGADRRAGVVTGDREDGVGERVASTRAAARCPLPSTTASHDPDGMLIVRVGMTVGDSMVCQFDGALR